MPSAEGGSRWMRFTTKHEAVTCSGWEVSSVQRCHLSFLPTPGLGHHSREGLGRGHGAPSASQSHRASLSLGFWGNSGGHMLRRVARPWRGNEVERATPRVSCRADVLGGPPW